MGTMHPFFVSTLNAQIIDASSNRAERALINQVLAQLDPKLDATAFFKVVVASTVVLRDFYHHGQLPFRVQIHRPDRVPVTCLA